MPKRKPGWSTKLSRSLTLKDGSKLVTLGDARACVIKYFSTVTQSASLERALSLLLKAAETGKYEDRKEATDQLAIVLRGRGVY